MKRIPQIQGPSSPGSDPQPAPPQVAGRVAPGAFARLLAALLTGLLVLTAARTAAGQVAPALDSAHVMAMAHRGERFVRPRAVALDPRHGEVAVANSGLGRIEFFDYRTWPRGFFTHSVPGPDGLPMVGEPTAVAYTATGELLVADLRAPYVDVLDYRGRSLRRLVLPAPDDTAGAARGPGALTVAPDGRILVASRGEGRVHVFSRDLEHLVTWGVTGRGEGQLAAITALAVDSAGRIFVACASSELAVQVFDAQGRFAFGFGRHELGPGNFSLPSGIAFGADGRVFVSDGIRQVVQAFDSGGRYVGAVGGAGFGPGEFHEPSALAGDGRGLLALAEKSGGRFQVLWLR